MKTRFGWQIFAFVFVLFGILGFFTIQGRGLVSRLLFPTPSTEPTEKKVCVERASLKCSDEPELSFECTSEYQSWAKDNCPGWEEQIFCGGIAGVVCPEGYSCQYDGNYPDAGGRCIQSEEKIPSLSNSELARGWYFGTKLQKKQGTPINWIYTEAGRSSCWHEPQIECRF
ncbi:TPA: hypothetical protein DIU27_03450 [Candidatus Collierbacteria bacterium]|nr:MAG: hypothetical protein UW31_C0007G0012 [Candidatus Collierbacteria bacterium GW2011_GWA2_44_13]KKT63164.1 MAG: hypothetical protein UW56_C0001G0001 [Candidatus Collierbacteria bacterium GW2011_GWD1_44_27]KKT66073.1 MAG: hypothetical protein UW58_C0013G0001 [Candidatus Collierbacteria bacterium GW2011_GWC2_44_30]KKT89249.1 MAG: hypothetical protein UW88_C0004G0030 [Candidatus Collierbacteria bacterium GW2011_GWD2_45_10]HCQ31408.1 hypothetical protein [Candidatus Collierbacteria bacterium]